MQQHGVVIPEKTVKEIEDKIKGLKEIRDKKVQEQLEMEEEAEKAGDWAHINTLIYPKSFVTIFPNLLMVTSGISKEEIKLWVEVMVEEHIISPVVKEAIEEKNTPLEMMRGVNSQLSRRPIAQVIQNFKLLKKIINRECEVIHKMVQICIDDTCMVAFWKGRVDKERNEQTVVQVLTPSSFQELHQAVMERWFKLLRDQELITPKQHQIHVLSQRLNPKPGICEIMNNIGALSYIKFIKALQKAGAESTAHKLVQENYLEPEPEPDLSMKKTLGA